MTLKHFFGPYASGFFHMGATEEKRNKIIHIFINKYEWWWKDKPEWSVHVENFKKKNDPVF